MKLVQIVLACTLMLIATSAIAAAKQKSLICHVDNVAGKIDLIVVSNTAKHLGNPSHIYGDISDYAPGEVGASSNGTEDSDGNGVDDGCEPPETCPCWDEVEMLSITLDDLNVLTCAASSNYPLYAIIENFYDRQDTSWKSFAAQLTSLEGGACYGSSRVASTTTAETEVCIEQVAVRCDTLGYPLD